MTDAQVWRRVGRVLWSMCEAERQGARIAKMLQDGFGLTHAERDKLDQTLVEEGLHMTLLREIADDLTARPPADAFLSMVERDVGLLEHFDEQTRFVWALAVKHWNERYSAFRFGDWVRVMDVLHPELGRRLAFIQQQERGHVAWCEAVEARVAVQEPAIARRITAAYQATRRIYPPVIHASHSATFLQAKAMAS